MELAFWKPNNKGTGNAAIFNVNEESGSVFLVMMPQDGERSFDSNKRSVVKLDLTDLSAMLAVAKGKVSGCGKDGNGLYHKSGNGSAIINLQVFSIDNKFIGLRLSTSTERDGNKLKNSIVIQSSEIELIRIFLEESIRTLLKSRQKFDK